MFETPRLVTLVGLPLWLAPPVVLIVMMTRLRAVRIGFGGGLIAVLALLYAVASGLWQGPGLPNWIEAVVLFGPTTLAVCCVAILTDRWLRRRRGPGDHSCGRRTGLELAGRWLAVAIGAWSLLCGCVVSSGLTEVVDLRANSPTTGMMLPLPNDLTLISADRDCGSEQCSDSYLIGSPDQVSVPEVTGRLWKHLIDAKGWERVRDDAGCQRRGWFLGNDFCVFVEVKRTEPPTLRVLVSGALIPA